MRTSYPPAGLEFGNAPSLKKHVPVPADPAETSVTRPFPEEQPWGWKTIDAMVIKFKTDILLAKPQLHILLSLTCVVTLSVNNV